MMSGLKSEKIIGSKIAIILGLKSTICVSFKILVAKLKKKKLEQKQNSMISFHIERITVYLGKNVQPALRKVMCHLRNSSLY